MNKTKIAFGIGIVLTVLVVFTASAVADNIGRFDPQHGSAETSGYVPVIVYADLDAGWDLAGSGFTLKFNPDIIDIYSVDFACDDNPPTGPDQYCWGCLDVNLSYKENGYIWAFNGAPLNSTWVEVPPPAHWAWTDMIYNGIEGPVENVEMYRIWVHPQSDNIPGVSPFEFWFEYAPEGCPICQKTGWINYSACTIPATFINGTFTHDYVINIDTDPTATNVTISNPSKDVDKVAVYDPEIGIFSLALDIPAEVGVGDELQITACVDLGDYESNCNVSSHTIVTAPGTETVNLTLNHYCQNYYPSFPFHTWEESDWSGPAAMEMLIDNYRDTSDVPNQTVLNETGLGYNQACNADILFVDPLGMKRTLNQYLHAYEALPYVANYGIGRYDSIEDVLHYICKWQYLGPGAAPAYGNYSNWMVIRGIHTNVKPSFTKGSYEIYGFWINDPYNATLEGPGGIGENTYKSVDQWSSIYHKKLNESGVNTTDNYYDKYVAVCEPPEDDDVVVTLAHAKPRFADAITPMLAEEPMMLYGAEQLTLKKVVRDNEMLKIVKAAIDGVNEELVPYDSEFAAVFAKTVPGKPILVTSGFGDYYIVPFNVPVEVKPVKKVPVAIERLKVSGLKKLKRVKRLAANTVIEPIEIEPIKAERTLVVVLVDAEDGSFEEASWVADPVKYLPVSKIEAMKLALGEVLDELNIVAKKDARDLGVIQQRPTIELVYREASPYYPDWKVTVNGKVIYVSQDGTASS